MGAVKVRYIGALAEKLNGTKGLALQKPSVASPTEAGGVWRQAGLV